MENNETWRDRFSLLWGIAPHDSLKGKKGAEVIAFFESELLILADKIEKEKFKFLSDDVIRTNANKHKIRNNALDTAINVIRDMAK